MSVQQSKPLRFPAITQYVDWVKLEHDGEDYILSYQFPGEVHCVVVLKQPPPDMLGPSTMRLIAANKLLEACPVDRYWKVAVNQMALFNHWAKSDLLTVINIQPVTRNSNQCEDDDG